MKIRMDIEIKVKMDRNKQNNRNKITMWIRMKMIQR